MNKKQTVKSLKVLFWRLDYAQKTIIIVNMYDFEVLEVFREMIY